MAETRAAGSSGAATPADPHASDHEAGLRHVEIVMGTAVSIDVRSGRLADGVLDRVLAHLHDIDARFSTYRSDSEISRIADGWLAEPDASPDVRFILGLCDDLARTTDGFFDARGHRADGRLDPSGVVKGWAIDEAAWMLEAAGATALSVNGGGDVVCRGGPAEGLPWRVGIRHPRERDRQAAVLAVRDTAVATSASYERGDHILVPWTHRPPVGLLSLTVVGPSLTIADAFATAAYAMGREGVAWVAARPGYEALGITDDDRLVWTPGMDGLLA
jgi:thiamine biosynthesis lipoprotein